MKCKQFQDEFTEYVLRTKSSANDPVDPELTRHMAGCDRCSNEAAGLRLTMNLMNEWHAPEPSAYFDQKMAVLLREEQANPPLSWFEKIRERIVLNTGRQFRPAMAAAMALVLVLGGGSYFGVTSLSHPPEVQASATVNDLQILDNNQQAIQQMDQLLDDDSSDPNPAQPSS